MDTIFAQATARGKAGVAIIRVSGPKAHDACLALCGDVPTPRLASLRTLTDVAGAVLDEALVLTFVKGASYTGEDSVEFHTHGGRAVCDSVLNTLSALEGLRGAEPGEFTRRALLNDRLDLTQVEGLADLIDAETEAQQKLALRTFSGEMSVKIQDWRARLVRAMALLEATIDFADEDVPEDVGPEVADLLNSLETELRAELRGAATAERMREGFEVAIVGRPNVGKSTFLNALAGRKAALTSEVAGTTRDVIEVRMDLSGLPVTFLDTAGLRVTSDVVESAGVALALERAEAADLRIFLVDSLSERFELGVQTEDLVVLSKGDLRESEVGAVSGQTGLGVEWVLGEIGARLDGRIGGMSALPHRRQRVALEEASNGISAAKSLLSAGSGLELASEELRRGIQALSVLIGDVDVEQVLGEIFSAFCIGK